MDRNQNNEKKPINDIKVSMGSRVRNVIRYCNSILKENNLRVLNFSAVGGAIGKLVSTVEVLRIVNPGFHQVNRIGSVSYQSVDNQGQVLNNRLYPKLDVTLTLDEPTEKSEGYQAPLTEEERLKIFDLHSQRLEGKPETGERGRGRGRGDRGRGRGGFRGRARGGNRGGFRERGTYRGAARGGARGGFSRGSTRGAPRGGFREGPPRGGFREGGFREGGFREGGFREGGFREGPPRGGFRGPSRGRGGFNGPRGGPRPNRGRGAQQNYDY